MWLTLEGEGVRVHLLELIVVHRQLVAHLQLVEGARRQISNEIAITYYQLLHGEFLEGLESCKNYLYINKRCQLNKERVSFILSWAGIKQREWLGLSL